MRSEKKAYDDALSDFNEALKLEPEIARYYLARAAAYEAKKDYDRSLTDLSEALRLDPNEADTWATLSDIAVLAGRVEEGLEHIRERARSRGAHDVGWRADHGDQADLRPTRRGLRPAGLHPGDHFAFAPFVRPTPQSDPWRHDRGRIVS